MSRRPNETSVNLHQAMELLIQNQAAFVRELAESNRRREEMKLESDRRFAESDRRFAAIERELAEIRRLLFELPEAIRQKIGFKSK